MICRNVSEKVRKILEEKNVYIYEIQDLDPTKSGAYLADQILKTLLELVANSLYELTRLIQDLYSALFSE